MDRFHLSIREAISTAAIATNITDHATAIGRTTSALNVTLLIFAMITAGSAIRSTYLSAHAVT
jgi:uncharacterized membrane protein